MTETRTSAERDDTLLLRVQKRDRGAFAELYQRYQPRLYAYLRRTLRDAQIIEEVVDDVMFVVWKDARRFAGHSAVSTWIFGIAYRRAVSAHRSESRHQVRVDHGADTDRLPADQASDHSHLKAALRRLSPDHRQVVELTYYFGYSYREIAEIAGCPENTVKTRMYHAKRRLKSLLPGLSGSKEDSDREQA